MKHNFLKSLRLCAFVVLVLCGAGTVWGANVVYKTALFGASYNSKGISSYTDTFSATNNNNNFTVDLTNFNNNNNGWNYVKTGNKSIASIGTIITSSAIDQAITKVVVTIDAITADKVNSIKLYTSSDKKTWNETGSFLLTTGAKEVTLESPATNLYYKVEFDCQKGSSNGLVTVSKVDYYYNSGGPEPPSISANDVSIAFDDISGAIEYTINNPVDGGALSAETTSGWLTIGTVGETVPFTCAANSSATARTATVTLTYTYGSNGSATKNVTVTQAGKDFATLPFSWDGGYSNNLIALPGVTANGLGSDYAASNAPYCVKFDNTGDYIQVKTNERPGIVTIGVKMLGGTETSFIIVQESANGATFSNLQTLSISGIKNAILTLSTTEDFAESSRYVRLYFNRGSNVGVGPISISKYGSVENPVFNPLGGTFYSEQSVTLSCTTEGATIKYSFDNSTWNTYTEPFIISETTTIYAKTVLGDAESDVVDATYTIAEKNDVVFNITNTELAYGESYNITRGSGKDIETDGYITVSTSNPNIASVNGLKITAEAVGTATISISVAEGNTYQAGQTTFSVTITTPEGLTTALPNPAANIFEERFNAANGSGPSGDTWTGTQANADFKADNEGWTSTGAMHSGDGCVKFGVSGEDGNGTTPAIAFDGTTTYTLTFRAGAWKDDNTTLVLSCDDENAVIGTTSFTMINNAWSEYSTTVKAADGSKLTFESKGNSYGRFFLDDVVITNPNAAAPTIPVTLNSSGYATFCSQYPLDFTNATDYSAWIVTGVNGNDITFVQLTGSVKGGTGILLKGTPSSTINLPSVDSETVPSGNLLEGTLAPTYIVDDTYYGLVGNEFLLIESAEGDPDTDRIAPAGKAILPASVVDGNIKTLNFVFNDETGIREVRTISAEEAAEIFNLAGQRLQKPQRGVNIVNGKKMLVK